MGGVEEAFPSFPSPSPIMMMIVESDWRQERRGEGDDSSGRKRERMRN